MRKHKLFAVNVIIAGVFFITGCGDLKLNSDNSENIGIGIDFTISNTDIPIYDINSKEIGCINCYGFSFLVDNYILYDKLPKNNVDEITELEYYLYDIDTKESFLLSTISDWYYEATLESVNIDNHVYLSLSTGEYTSFENSKTIIYDIDLIEHKMSPLLEIEGGIPYNSYTIVGNTLILAELLENGHTDIITCSIHNNSDTPTVHKYDSSECFTENSIRHIYTDQQFIYMIRLRSDDNDNTFLYLDKYDLDLNLVNTIDISNSCINPNFDADSVTNERRQFIPHFFVDDSLFYYENASMTNFLGIIENAELESILDIDQGQFSYVHTLCQHSDFHYFIDVFNFYDDQRNTFYRVDAENRTISTAQFFASEPKLTFNHACINDEGRVLMAMSYVPEYDGDGERIPTRYFCFDINDLTFEPIGQNELTQNLTKF